MMKKMLQLTLNGKLKSLVVGRWAGALLVVLCVSLLAPFGAMATTQGSTYYVATTGSDSNTGSSAEPWRTIAHAVTEMVPGDTTYVHSGVYDEHVIHFTRSGTEAAPIKLLAAPGEYPVINFIDTTSVYSRILIDHTGNDQYAMGWITIQGFEIRNGWDGIAYHNVDDLTIRDNWIHDSLYQGIAGNGTRVLIDRNIISGNGQIDTGSNEYHGIYVNGTGVTITNNLIYNNTAYGIQLNGSPSSYYDPTKEPGPEYALSANWLIANNTIAYNRNRAAIVVWGSTCNNARIINNIFYENGVSLSSYGIQGIDFVDMTATGIQIDNNLSYASGSGATVFIDSQAQEGVNYTQSGNIVNVAPDFVNAGDTLPAIPNFALQNTSPAIDQGLSVTEVTADFTGTPRPQGSAFDIGAYEFQFALISDLVVNDTTNAADWSIRSNLQNGDDMYGDRTYTIDTLPASLAGSDWIRPANDSKTYTGTTLVTFKVSENSTVYVVHDDNSTPMPTWLTSANGWTDSGLDMTNSPQGHNYTIYSKSYRSGSTVSLGRTSTTDTNDNTYIIIVKPASAPLITNMVVNDTTNAADWSIQSNIQSGDELYGDRTYTIVSLPLGLAGSDWIRPANDSKAYTGTTLVTFKVNEDSTVYVAESTGITTPSWLSGWTDTGTQMTNSQSPAVTYEIYSKQYAAGSTVSLGPRSDTSSDANTYIIIVKPVTGGGGPTTLSSIADTYAKDGTYATTNYGTDAAIEVKTQTVNADREGFIKFDVSGIGSVSSATLRLYSIYDLSATPIDIDVYGVSDDSWLETALDWNNKPAAVGSVLSSQTLTAVGWYEWDVTDFVNSQLADGVASFELQAPNSASPCPNFASRKNVNVPELIITP